MAKYNKGIGRPGKLRWPLEIRTISESVDSSGASIEIWNSPSSVIGTRASIEPISGGEEEQDGRRVADQLYMIVIQYQSSGITVKDRLYDPTADRLFTILAISRDNRNRRLMLTCREMLDHVEDGR